MKLPTIAVMAHGFNRIYPYEHRHIADRMLENGGLLSDFHSNAPFHPGNFPARNRIVAGLTDATLVIESAEKGGSLITADLANGYHREVFALPGRTTDTQSKGCNLLIKTNRAALVESAAELIAEMGWESKKNKKNIQHALWPQLSEEEQHLLKLMNKETGTHSDELINNSGLNGGKLSALLLGLELKGLIYAIPGNRYRLN
jgi:DNA processing protein